MYEIGRVYIWQNQVDIAAHINGVETIPDQKPARYRNMLTGQTVWGQHCINADGAKWIACKGDLRPKNPPSGERSVTNIFKVPHHEPA